MGVCGAGPDTIHHNTIALIEKNYILKKLLYVGLSLLDKCGIQAMI